MSAWSTKFFFSKILHRATKRALDCPSSEASLASLDVRPSSEASIASLDVLLLKSEAYLARKLKARLLSQA